MHVRATLIRIKGRTMVRGAPKTTSSLRSVPLPRMTVAHLRRHRAGQRQAHLAAGVGWAEADYVLTSRRGAPLDPSNLPGSGRLHRGLRAGRVRLHACVTRPRPSCSPPASTLAVISNTLGHSGVATITADSYATVVPQLQRDAADAMQRALGRGVRLTATSPRPGRRVSARSRVASLRSGTRCRAPLRVGGLRCAPADLQERVMGSV